MSIAMSNGRESTVEVITSVDGRRRLTKEEKLALVRQTFEPGQTVSMVARHAGVAASQLFQWRRLYQEGSLMAVSAGESVVAASELQEALKRNEALGTCSGSQDS